jgi:flagellar basal body-associated protein FliL
MKVLKKKFVMLPLILLLVGGGVYMKMFKPKPVPPPKKVEGAVVSLGNDFVVNLSGGHYGKISVALLLSEAPPAPAAEAGGGGESSGSGLPEDAVVRSVITDELTGLAPNDLISRDARHRLVTRLEDALKKKTDEPVKDVLLTDVAVQ